MPIGISESDFDAFRCFGAELVLVQWLAIWLLVLRVVHYLESDD